ncbi:glyoxalase-like protein [Nocardia tenerifensis]|uniref:Glyoxalase-like protein n=2 Tax=Nocardia tenerifensis TaxID=228006 RepID=A0A318KD07_9NOCA|nr:glyoxalase-like protein [Nocardia tenerifensis]
MLTELVERITATSATVAACLDRYEGLHILMFASPDIDAAAARLSAAGVGHGAVNSVQRPVRIDGETLVETVRYLEIDSAEPTVRRGAVEEGRVGVVAGLDPRFQNARRLSHPNGAFDLVEVVICAAAGDFDALRARYENYVGYPSTAEGAAQVFDMGSARLVLIPDSALAERLPGETAPALPSLVAYTVAVRDLDAARERLRINGCRLGETDSGDPFVPAEQALGAAIIFRQSGPTAL